MTQVMDVIVIGCGASGIAAIRKLHDAGLKVLGLEAAERIGGRIHTIPFGDGVVDIGAAWCHGEKDNIVYEIANPLDLLGRPGPVQQATLLSNGETIHAQKITKALDDAVAKASKKSDKSILDTLKEEAETNQNLSKDPLTPSVVEWYSRNNHLSGQDDPRKGKSLKGLEECWGCEGEFWLHWKGRGYTTLLDVLLNRYPDPSKKIPVELLLHKEVEWIKWAVSDAAVNPLVQVKCKDDSLYVAKSVIVTISVGALKERHTTLFSPPLPADKITSINTLQLCVLDKIYVEFDKPWWEQPINFKILWREEDKKHFRETEKWVTEIHGAQTIESQRNVLLFWIYGNGAKAMEKVSMEEVRAGIEKLLMVVFKKYTVAGIKDLHRTKWFTNRFVRGTYSYRSVETEQNGGGASTLGEPLYNSGAPVLCFAGEATSEHRHNSVHGAIEAGFREADRLIKWLNK